MYVCVVQHALEKEREAYLPLAQEASLLFFVIASLSKADNTYQFRYAATPAYITQCNYVQL